MANYSTNALDVTGDLKALNRFKNKFYKDKTKTEFTFNKIVPKPKEIEGTTSPCPESEKELQEELTKKYGSGNWYDWSIENWGCKWDASDCAEVEEIEDGLRFIFQTAWNPPIPFIKKAATCYPQLRFRICWVLEGFDGSEVSEIFWDEGLHEDTYGRLTLDWYSEFDADFQRELELIEDRKFDEILENGLTYSDMLNKVLLDKLTDTDLPLFLNYWWEDEEEAFDARLKGG